MTALLGLDIGTTGVKALLIDDAGAVLAGHTVEHSLSTPKPRWAEQDPEDWYRGAIRAVAEVVRESGVPSDSIAGIGLSGQMHSSVLLDRNMDVIRPAILWCDARSESACRTITGTVGEDYLIETACNPALAGFTLPHLVWVRENEPEAFARISTVILAKDFVRYRLTGELLMEMSDASGTIALDVRKRQWAAGLLQKIDIDPAVFPPLVESTEVAGRLTKEVAEQTGLKAGIPVVAGGADNACGAVGAGIVRQGRVLSSLGTSGTIVAHTDTAVVDPDTRVHTFCHGVPGRWYVMGVTLTAGGSFRWFRDRLAPIEAGLVARQEKDPYDLMIEKAQMAPPGAEGLVFLPYLNGERTPHKDADARGAWVGLTLRHGFGHLCRAVMEGILFAMRDSLEIIKELGLPIDQIRLIGGGARSAFWRKMHADIYNLPVATVNVEEGPAFGAALLAGVGAGVYPSVEQAAEAAVRVVEEIEPDPRLTDTYGEVYSVFRKLYPALRPAFVNLGAVADSARDG